MSNATIAINDGPEVDLDDAVAALDRGNSQADLRHRAERLSNVLDEIAERQEEAKQIREEAKAAGYDPKVLNQVVKEQRKGLKYQAAQLEMELVLDTYRRATGLPTNFEDAQDRVARSASEMAEGEAR